MDKLQLAIFLDMNYNNIRNYNCGNYIYFFFT